MKIVWSSFDGRYSDSPRALYEALRSRRDDLEHTWLAKAEHRSTFPDHATTVDAAGAEAVAALEAADLVVANTHVRLPWTKRAGATYVQTWHGTPLKTVHRDVLWAPDGLLDELDEDVAKWDLLLSPNPHSTRYLSQAFRWTGALLESGYPRNDVLSPPAHDERRAEVRARLGIEDDRTVVLYAPTWRDEEGYDPSRPVPVRLDVEAFGAALGEDHTLLVRAHNMVTGRWEVTGADWLQDVSIEPSDVADLYTAADVLITDYSSVMFDFAVTGRPILFLVADLEQYASVTRGFYLDLWPQAPGPQLRDTDEVVAALRDLPAVEKEFSERYAAFAATYTSLEDGHATERVLDHLGL
ncbi:CDP-glycerol glycerophosphotransferase family protein [Nocardioides scoriae]|uniref:CDP-glycerol glycerophosphotransferase family protein n=1 Tax=Nocardioides scoriae TaxID=642780 RepID=UPI000B894E53|nr:CDP-glycerol glycerophosphotransferase family protein [Nocardioides scoriae]